MARRKAVRQPPPPSPDRSEGESEEKDPVEENENRSGADEESDHGQERDEEPDATENEVDNQEDPEEEEEEEDEDEEEEEEDEEDPGSPPSPNESDFTVKPIIQKKRPSSSVSNVKDDEKAVRSSKKIKTSKGEEKKDNNSAIVSASNGAGRVWSLDDQIALLQGMVDYQNKTGADPFSDKDAFHKFIKKKLQADISKSQMYDKVRRLRKKFEEKADSNDLASQKPYDLKLFDLSKKIWGKVDAKKDKKTGNSNGNVKEVKNEDLVMDAVSEEDDLDKDDNGDEVDLVRSVKIDAEGTFQSKYPNLVQSFDLDLPNHFPADLISFVKERMGAIGSVKAAELEENWKKVRLQEAELYVEKMELMNSFMKEYIQLVKMEKNVK